jgi:hypothetical protein
MADSMQVLDLLEHDIRLPAIQNPDLAMEILGEAWFSDQVFMAWGNVYGSFVLCQ